LAIKRVLYLTDSAHEIFSFFFEDPFVANNFLSPGWLY